MVCASAWRAWIGSGRGELQHAAILPQWGWGLIIREALRDAFYAFESRVCSHRDAGVTARLGPDADGKTRVLPVRLSPERQLLHAVIGQFAASFAKKRLLPVRLSPKRRLLSGQQQQLQTRHAQIGFLPVGLPPERRLLPEKLIVVPAIEKTGKTSQNNNNKLI